MKISLRWLNDYVDVEAFFNEPQRLADILTASGLEVEAVDNQKQKYNHVVIGHLLQVGKHPSADRLTLCEVAVGNGVVHQIVCGATNHKKDDKVVVALPGAILPGDFAIKLSKIRGVESQGMLCSEVELGLAKESAGIMILPMDAPIGQTFSDYMGLNDIILEVNITPNRPDCMSHFGLAREVASLLSTDFEFPVSSFVESGSTKDLIDLQVVDVEACPRYAGRAVLNVKIGPSPDWMKKRLEAVGVNSINNVVDITNFVMLELGQPLHAFDLRFLRGNKIIVKASQAHEGFTTFDGTVLKMTGQELSIRDQEGMVALAGIVGGPNSGIQPDTQNVFIECAHFQPAKIRRTSRQLGINTDASYRFSRGVDPEGVMLALNRTCQLLQDLAQGKVQGSPHDFYPHPEGLAVVELNAATVSERLGTHVSGGELKSFLTRMQCQVVSEAGEQMRVQPPLYRRDLLRDVDFIEDIGRLKGFDHIPEMLPKLNHSPTRHHPQYLFHNELRRTLSGQGFLESVHYAFQSSAWQTKFIEDETKMRALGLMGEGSTVSVRNPLNEELNVMRTQLSCGLVKNVELNQHHGNFSGRIFEIGSGYFANQGEYIQQWHLGLVAWGKPISWANKTTMPIVFELRNTLENLFLRLQGRNWRLVQAGEKFQPPAFLHPGQSAGIFYEGKWIGFIGTLHPKWREELKLREDVALIEMNLDRLMQGQPRALTVQPISKFQPVDRDFAFLMPKSLAVADLSLEIKKAGGELVRAIDVFDVFEGDKLGEEQRSVAFRVRFQDMSATLTEAQINELHEKIINSLSQKFPISVR